MTVVAAVAGVVGAAVTGGASVAAAVSFATISGAAGIGASAAAHKEQEVTGEDVEEILSSMIDSYWDIVDSSKAVEEDLNKLLGEDLTSVGEQADRYRPMVPDIVGYGNNPSKDRDTREEFEPPA